MFWSAKRNLLKNKFTEDYIKCAHIHKKKKKKNLIPTFKTFL